MNRADVTGILRTAVGRLLDQDRFLLKYDVHECAIAHRIAVYLEAPCAGFDVDCEYNNDLDSESGRKEVFLPGKSTAEAARPDIVVHQRGKNGGDCNLLVVEVKKLVGGPGRLGRDCTRLESPTPR